MSGRSLGVNGVMAALQSEPALENKHGAPVGGRPERKHFHREEFLTLRGFGSELVAALVQWALGRTSFLAGLH